MKNLMFVFVVCICFAVTGCYDDSSAAEAGGGTTGVDSIDTDTSELINASIQNIDTAETFKVNFNYTTYLEEKETIWVEHEIQGLDTPPIEFTSGERLVATADLYFDTSEDNKDVRTVTNPIYKLMLVNADEHRPPLLLWIFGATRFKCVMEKMELRFTKFNIKGIPVGAKMTVTFKQYDASTSQFKEKPRH